MMAPPGGVSTPSAVGVLLLVGSFSFIVHRSFSSALTASSDGYPSADLNNIEGRCNGCKEQTKAEKAAEEEKKNGGVRTGWSKLHLDHELKWMYASDHKRFACAKCAKFWNGKSWYCEECKVSGLVSVSAASVSSYLFGCSGYLTSHTISFVSSSQHIPLFLLSVQSLQGLLPGE